MYEVDDKDQVTELRGMPVMSTGAPLPAVLGGDHAAVLRYRTVQEQAGLQGRIPQMVDPSDPNLVFSVVRFLPCYALMFGPPNDEALRGHPLAARGLKPYGAFEVMNSSWIRRLERMNSVHPQHEPDRFLTRRHVILTFQDNTFECVCDRFDVISTRATWNSILLEMGDLLNQGAG